MGTRYIIVTQRYTNITNCVASRLNQGRILYPTAWAAGQGQEFNSAFSSRRSRRPKTRSDYGLTDKVTYKVACTPLKPSQTPLALTLDRISLSLGPGPNGPCFACVSMHVYPCICLYVCLSVYLSIGLLFYPFTCSFFKIFFLFNSLSSTFLQVII